MVLRDELRAIQRSAGITTIFVTHDQTEALGLSDRIAVMNRGRLEQLGAPRAIDEHPTTRFVADFVGASTVLRAGAVDAARVAHGNGPPLRGAGARALTPGAEVARLVGGQKVRVFVAEPAPAPRAAGQAVHVHLPAEAFMVPA